MLSQKDFEEIIAFYKQEHQLNGWNALDISCRQLINTSSEASEAAKAMVKNMMTGDQFIQGSIDTLNEDLVVRYYCDNLDESRGRMF